MQHSCNPIIFLNLPLEKGDEGGFDKCLKKHTKLVLMKLVLVETGSGEWGKESFGKVIL
jgi:hypothetical protein